MSTLRNLIKILIILIVVTGCRGTEKTDDKNSTGGSSGDASKDTDKELPPDASAGFNVTVQPDAKYTYKIHRGTGISTDNWDTPCKVDPAAADPDRHITCIVEAHELDLFFFGVGIRFNVPPSMCNYVRQSVPYFYRYEPGPGAVSVIDNRAGTTTNGGVAVGAVGPYLTCPYDYSAAGGPNCCTGSYSLSIYTDDPTSGTDKLAVSTQQWGGKASNCLAGPAMTVAKLFTSDGYPADTMIYVEGIGKNIGYFLKAPIEAPYASNIYVANYYSSTEHVGGLPKMFKATGFRTTQSAHEFWCVNRAEEISASIKVYVREWNTVDQLAAGAAGNSDVTGTESGGFGQFNDRSDLKDLGEFYPGLAL